MSEDRTIPMQQPQGSRGETSLDDQETVLSDSESMTPPTMPLGDQETSRPLPNGGFVRAASPGGVPAQPYPSAQAPGSPQAPTMIISQQEMPVFAWLVVLDGPDRSAIGTVHTLHPDTTTIGRVPGNRVILQDETVSAQHARIRREAREGEEAHYALYDMGSRNGISVGDRETYRDDENQVYRHELKDGDYLLVGETTLVFKSV